MQFHLILALIASSALQACAINCYLCESAYEPHCGEDFEEASFYKFDCARVPPPRFLENDLESQNATACMKKSYMEAGVRKVIRSCFFGDVNDTTIGCRTDPSLTSTVQEVACHVCDNESYCNGSETMSHFGPPRLLALLALLICLTLAQS